MAIRIGTEFSHFRILEEIGQGGMGVVYRAEDTLHGRTVAIKVLCRDTAVDPAVTRRFQREAGAGAGLIHPSIVQMFESGVHEGEEFIVLEFVDGRNLRDTVSCGPLPPRRVVEIGIAAGDALQLAHNNGIIHRDVKAENIMITTGGDVKVMDFGLAKIQNASLLTQEGDVVGTVAYMSPEQATGEQVDPRTDIFSLGVVLYELLTGRLPFWAAYDTAIIYSILNTEPPGIRQVAPDVPEAMEQIVMKALRKDRNERYQTVQEMVNDLARLKSFFDGERDTLPSALELVAGAGQEEKDSQESPIRLEVKGGFHSVLAGREHEFLALKSRLEKSAAGSCEIVFITGEAGIGKTRLAAELSTYARSLRVRMLHGRCVPGARAYPYQPVSEALQEYFHDKGITTAESLERFTRELLPDPERHLPALKFFLRVSESETDGLVAREQLWETVGLMLTGISRDRPLLLFFDDLHWADEESLLLTGYLGRTAVTARLMIVGTYRSGEVEQGPAGESALVQIGKQLACGDRFERIVLDRLDRSAVGTMIGSLFPDADFGESFVDAMFRETEGNPFFLVETLKLLRMEGAIEKTDGRHRIRENFEQIAIPRSIHDIVMRRIDRLDEQEREILEIGAVEGETFHSGTIGACIEVSRVRLLKILQTLERDHHIIHAEEKTYRFDHGKIREFLYDAITPELRVEFHRMIGEYLAETFPDDERLAAGISHHFLRGENEERAFPHLVRAGEWAKRLYANTRAVEFYLGALSIGQRRYQKRTDPLLAGQMETVMEGLADVWSLTGNYRDAIEKYGSLASLPHITGGKRADLLRKMGGLYEHLGDNERALAVLNRAEGEITKARFSAARAGEKKLSMSRLRITRSRVFKALGRYLDAEKEIEESLKVIETTGNEQDKADAYKNLGTIYEDIGRFDLATGMFEKDLTVRRKIGDKKGVAVAYNNLANLYADEGDYAKTADALQKSLDIMTEIGFRAGIAGTANNLGSVFQDQGRYEEALAMHQRCLAIRTEIGDKPDIAMSYGNLGSVKLSLGDFEGAAADLEENLRLSGDMGFRIFESQVYSWLAIAYLNLSLTDKAREAAVKSMRTAEEMEQRHQIAVAKRTWGILMLAGISPETPSMGDPDREAEKELKESLDIFEELKMKHEAGRSHLELARLYNDTGETEKCKSHLLGAKTIFQQLGAFGDLATANALHLKTT